MLGRGGIATVARATGISYRTVQRALREVERGEEVAPGRVRRPGGGRKKSLDLDPTLPTDLQKAIEPTTRGDPESSLRWTCKSTRSLTRELRRGGHGVSEYVVRALLHEMSYSLQANRKTREGRQHPDRNAQFEYIDRSVTRQVRGGGPAISVDTTKKELVGDCKNGGPTWRPRGKPHNVRVHDFLDRRKYPTEIKVTDEQMDAIHVRRASLHGEWNYTISPRRASNTRRPRAGRD